MKSLSFSAIEILPSLLNHTKVQTIRPLFCIPCSKSVMSHFDHIANKKEPRLQVGDRVQLVWKRFSPKDAWFCRGCGNELEVKPLDLLHPSKFRRTCLCAQAGEFPKILGTAEIIGVDTVKMWADGTIYFMDGDKVDHGTDSFSLDSLATRDGFKNKDDFFGWFSSHYDLSIPRKFACYRWKYL